MKVALVIGIIAVSVLAFYILKFFWFAIKFLFGIGNNDKKNK